MTDSFDRHVQLAVGFVVAEETLSADENLSKLFYECKDFVVRACQGSIGEKVQDLCQVLI